MVAIRLRPDVLLLGWELFAVDGGGLLDTVRLQSPRTKVILLTSRAPRTRILDALAHGARGYLDRRLVPTFLAKAVQVVDAGEAWVPRRLVPDIVDRFTRLKARSGSTN